MQSIVILISRDLYQKLMNTNKLSRSLYQKLILLFNNSVDLYWGLQLCICDLNTVLGLVCTLMNNEFYNHGYKIRPKPVRTNYFKFSSFNRYVTDWNSLPTYVMSSPSLQSSKSSILKHLLSQIT